MPENKTKKTEIKPIDYIKSIKEEKRKEDISKIVLMIENQFKLEPKMWGPSIIGFGSYHYKYDSGHEGDSPLIGLASRSSGIVFYLSENFENRKELLEELGKHKTEKACIYVKNLADINSKILIKILKNQMNHIKKLYPDK